MKRLLVSLALACATLLAAAGGNDIVFTKRNPADTAQGPVTPAHPTTCVGLMAYDSATLLPLYLCPGSGLSVSGGVIDVASGSTPTWSTLLGKPSWTGVFDGSYASLTSPPTLGTAAALNVAFSGDAAAGEVVKGSDSRLTDARTPTAHTHAIADVTGLQTALNGKAAMGTTLASYGITDGVTSASLATTLSGYPTNAVLATGLSGKFDIPSGTAGQCVRGNGSISTCGGAGTVTSVGITSSTLSIGGSPITSSGSMTVDLPVVATAGTYDRVTVDTQGRVTAGVNRSFASPSRALSTCFQISATRDALVSYAVDVTTTVTLGGTPEGAVFLRTYTNSGCSTGQVSIVSGSSGQPTSVTVAVNQQIKGSVNLYGMVPAGTWARVETSNVSGTPTYAIRAEQQEVLF